MCEPEGELTAAYHLQLSAVGSLADTRSADGFIADFLAAIAPQILAYASRRTARSRKRQRSD